MLGYFVELHRDGRSRPTSSLDAFTLGRPVTLQDCFDFLIAKGVIDRTDLEAALVALQDETPVSSRKVRRVVEVIEAFRLTSAD